MLRTVLVAAALLLVGAVAIWIYGGYRAFERTPLRVAAPTSIEVARGSTLKSIVAQLRARHYTSAAEPYWRLLAARMGVTDRLHAGEYALSPGMTPPVLLANMSDGRVVQHMFTLVDGWTFAQVRAALARVPALRHTLAGMSDAQVARALGIHGASPEGWLLPQTYAYVLGQSDIDVLRRAHVAMERLLAREWPGRERGIPLKDPYQALVLASLIEKETAQPDERARIAGVFVRRLERGMKLQTDPSVIYGLGAAYRGEITRRDLQTDTPWNTYTRFGLPPTPICMPGAPAVEAALHPAQGRSLYFVAKGDGTHQFSDTLRQQDAAIGRYILHRKP